MADTDATRRGRNALRRAKSRWGSGWSMLSRVQREHAIAYEVTLVLLAQDESLAPPGSPLERLQAFARASFALIEPGEGEG